VVHHAKVGAADELDMIAVVARKNIPGW